MEERRKSNEIFYFKNEIIFCGHPKNDKSKLFFMVEGNIKLRLGMIRLMSFI